MMPFNPYNWYWAVVGDPTRVYSSAAANYVLVGDAAYQSWLAGGNVPTSVDSPAAIADTLDNYGLPPPPGTSVSDTHKENLFSSIPKPVKVWSLDVDNRVRALEGQPARNANQFKNYVKSLM